MSKNYKEIKDKLRAVALWVRENKEVIKESGFAVKLTVMDRSRLESESVASIESCGACSVSEACSMCETDILGMYKASGRDCLIDFFDEHFPNLSERLDEEYEDIYNSNEEDEDEEEYPPIGSGDLFS